LISVGCGLCRVQVDASGFPVDATVVHVVNGQHVKQQQFFVRVGNGTKGHRGRGTPEAHRRPLARTR